MSDTTPPGRGKQAGRFRFQFLAKIRNLQILASLDITCGGGIYLLSGSSASYLWMDFSNSMPGKPGKSAYVEFRTRFGRNFVQCPHGLAVDGKCMERGVRRSANAFGTKREMRNELERENHKI